MNCLVSIVVPSIGQCVSVTVKEDTLMDMVLSLTESVGLVHQIPFVSDREGFSGVLEKVCLMAMYCFQIWIHLV